ncbi:MAG: protein kinase domain-containing protein [Acidimicrobiia bacterium]
MELIDDRYELLEVIASGGMASVWRARDTRLNRVVALKRPHPAPADDPSHRRMEREARAASSFSHPNLVTVYDYGRDDAGPFVVMEMVEGPTLEEIAGDLDPAGAVEIGSQLADALAAIHAVGIIHRDIKPANVLMSERGPLLTDFGVALHPEMTSEITQPGKVVATPSYAAPEVLEGQPPSTASDVYSLGLVIYELVAQTPMSPGTGQDVEPPPLADPRIDSILRPALSASPEERPAAAALAVGLAGSSPTLTAMTPKGSTMVMDPVTPADPVAVAGGTEPSPETGRLWKWLLVAALGVLAIVLSLGGQIFSDPETLAVGVTSTTAQPSSTTAPTTTTTTLTTTTVDSVDTTRDELEAILLGQPRSDIKPSDARDILKKVDEAIEAAERGDSKESAKKLEEAADKLEEKLEGERLTRARAALQHLAELLGVSFEDEDDD